MDSIQLLQLTLESRLVLPHPIKEPKSFSSLLVISNNYNYIGLGVENGFYLVNLESSRSQLKLAPVKTRIPLENGIYIPTRTNLVFLRLGADESKLWVSTEDNHLLMYHIPSILRDIQNINNANVKPLVDISCDFKDFLDIRPNPESFPDICTVLSKDGNVYMCYENGNIVTISLANPISSVCWSRKGKQIVCGDLQGNLHQVTPDGTVKKSIPPPSTSENNVSFVQQVLWLEDSLFITIYADSQEDSKECTAYIVSIDKATKQVEYTNCQDPSPNFSNDESKSNYYHMETLKSYGKSCKYMILFGNVTCDEIGVIGCDQESSKFENWPLSDPHNASMPLDEDQNDTWLVGMSLDYASIETLNPLPGDDERIPPVPILWVYNNIGWLFGYQIMNMTAIKNKEKCDVMVAPTSSLVSCTTLSTTPKPTPLPSKPTSMMSKQEVKSNTETKKMETKTITKVDTKVENKIDTKVNTKTENTIKEIPQEIKILINKFNEIYSTFQTDLNLFIEFQGKLNEVISKQSSHVPQTSPLGSWNLNNSPHISQKSLELHQSLKELENPSFQDVLNQLKDTSIKTWAKKEESKILLGFLNSPEYTKHSQVTVLGPEAQDLKNKIDKKVKTMEKCIDDVTDSMENVKKRVLNLKKGRDVLSGSKDWLKICKTVSTITHSAIALSIKCHEMEQEMSRLNITRPQSVKKSLGTPLNGNKKLPASSFGLTEGESEAQEISTPLKAGKNLNSIKNEIVQAFTDSKRMVSMTKVENVASVYPLLKSLLPMPVSLSSNQESVPVSSIQESLFLKQVEEPPLQAKTQENILVPLVQVAPVVQISPFIPSQQQGQQPQEVLETPTKIKIDSINMFKDSNPSPVLIEKQPDSTFMDSTIHQDQSLSFVVNEETILDISVESIQESVEELDESVEEVTVEEESTQESESVEEVSVESIQESESVEESVTEESFVEEQDSINELEEQECVKQEQEEQIDELEEQEHVKEIKEKRENKQKEIENPFIVTKESPFAFKSSFESKLFKESSSFNKPIQETTKSTFLFSQNIDVQDTKQDVPVVEEEPVVEIKKESVKQEQVKQESLFVKDNLTTPSPPTIESKEWSIPKAVEQDEMIDDVTPQVDTMEADQVKDLTSTSFFDSGSSNVLSKPSLATAVNPMFSSPFASNNSTGQTGFSSFGNSTSVSAFGSAPAPAAPVFGQASLTPPTNPVFGQSSFVPSTPSFGQSSTPSFGQSSFGQSNPVFGQSSLAKSTTPVFGQSTTPSFGQSSFGQAQPSTATFGQSSFGQAQPAFGQSSFGQGQPTFGSTSFGQSNPVFGSTSLQNPTNQSVFGASTSFNNSAPSFSSVAHQGPSTTVFGGATAPSIGFGSFASQSPQSQSTLSTQQSSNKPLGSAFTQFRS